MTGSTLHKHPQYDYNFEDWKLCTQLFEGKHGVVCKDTSILWPHAIEEPAGLDLQSALGKLVTDIGSTQWHRRTRRTRWLAIPEIIASLLISFIFRKQPDFSEVEDLFGEQMSNVDGQGNSLYSFLKNSFALDYLKYGKAIIKVESSRHSAATLADEIGANVRPYFTSVNPLNMPDWELADGPQITNFNWLRYEYDRVKNRTKATEEPKTERISKAYYKNGNSVIYEVYQVDTSRLKANTGAWQLVGQDELKLSRIPFVVVEDVSWLKDVNQEALRYHNIRSSRDNILHNQGYQKVVVSGVDPNDPKQLQGMNETNWILVRDPSASVTAIEPPDLGAHERALDEALNNCFKVGLNQLRLLPSDSKVAQAADSISEEKDNTAALIESTLEDIENAANEAISLWAEYKGIEGYDGKISIEKNFSNDDINQFLKVYNSTRDLLSKYQEVQKMVTKKAVRSLGLQDDEQELALAEVEAGIITEDSLNNDDEADNFQG